ncbi:acid trehalase, partial [Aspergillus sclerotialis]
MTGSDNVDFSRTQVCDKPYVNTNESSIAQSVKVNFSANEPVRITKFVGGAPNDAFTSAKQTARHAVSA